ncbi:PH domain-containing protein [Candidatus Sumerlaeota bacterium]|nr:PH domain-containing protein [Candidatus Sumerlaeota bacterium]
MYNLFKTWILHILKVPPEPEDPAGAENSLRVFRAAPNYYKYKVYIWLIRSAFAALFYGILLVILLVAIFSTPMGINLLVAIAELGLLCFAVAHIFVDYVILRLDYEMRWYKVTDRSLRIREGVLMVREMTMTFANIQNIAISQGPIQRYFNIADLKVETAGGGGGMAQQEQQGLFNMHIGYFRGVDNAEEIRDLMLLRLRNLKGAGLGDFDDEEEDEPTIIFADAPPRPSELLDVVKAIREEARRLHVNAETLAYQAES